LLTNRRFDSKATAIPTLVSFSSSDQRRRRPVSPFDLGTALITVHKDSSQYRALTRSRRPSPDEYSPSAPLADYHLQLILDPPARPNSQEARSWLRAHRARHHSSPNIIGSHCAQQYNKQRRCPIKADTQAGLAGPVENSQSRLERTGRTPRVDWQSQLENSTLLLFGRPRRNQTAVAFNNSAANR